MYITRRERFSSAHRLINNKLTIKENKKIFDKCYEFHGHNYELFVTIFGTINENTGFVVDLKQLKSVIQQKVIKKLDHQYINDVDFMKNKIASTENLCIQIWKELAKPVQVLGARIHRIKIKETENNSFEYFGENK